VDRTITSPAGNSGALAALCLVCPSSRIGPDFCFGPPQALPVKRNGNNPLIADQSGFTVRSENTPALVEHNLPHAAPPDASCPCPEML
jgi:hypothetical protein